MLGYALLFFILAILAAIVGFGGFVTGSLVLISKVCLGLFLLFFLVSLVFGRGTPPAPYV